VGRRPRTPLPTPSPGRPLKARPADRRKRAGNRPSTDRLVRSPGCFPTRLLPCQSFIPSRRPHPWARAGCSGTDGSREVIVLCHTFRPKDATSLRDTSEQGVLAYTRHKRWRSTTSRRSHQRSGWFVAEREASSSTPTRHSGPKGESGGCAGETPSRYLNLSALIAHPSSVVRVASCV
jgi:hypothetical protein